MELQKSEQSQYHSVYASAKWQKLREIVLTREPLCRLCKLHGMIRAAVCVDHIVPIKEGGDPYDEKNLQPLCGQCHTSKTMSGMRGNRERVKGCDANGLPLDTAGYWRAEESTTPPPSFTV